MCVECKIQGCPRWLTIVLWKVPGPGEGPKVLSGTYCELLKLTGETQPLVWLDKMFDCSQDKKKWRSMVHDLELREAPKLIATRRSKRIRNRK